MINNNPVDMSSALQLPPSPSSSSSPTTSPRIDAQIQQHPQITTIPPSLNSQSSSSINTSIEANPTLSNNISLGPILSAVQAYVNTNQSNGRQQQQVSSSSSEQQSVNGRPPLTDFESVYESFKKRTRDQYDRGNSESQIGSSSKDLEEKLDFMAQLITIQAAKIRKMEVRMKKLESLLPQSGDDFVNSSTLHRVPVLLSGGNQAIDEMSSISDDVQSLPTLSSKKEKGNRQPNAYNIFMKSEIQRIRTTHTELTQKEAFKLAASNWTLKKNEILLNAQKKGHVDLETKTELSTLDSDVASGTPATEEK